MKAASLNHVYRLIWSKVQQAWVAVAEGTRTSGKSSLHGQVNGSKESGNCVSSREVSFTSDTKWRVAIATAFAATLMPFSSFADTNVVAGVVAGDLTIKDISATHTQYTHTANVNIVNFYKFGVLEGHQLDVVMPDAGRALYRVLGNSASEIMGKLNSNGSLFLINQNGVLFGPNAEVNVGNIVASTLNISNDDFLKGRYHFTGGDTAGNVINKGAIKAADEGYIVMLGKKVENAGTLVASNGSVVLASAKEAVLDFYGNGLVRANLTAQAVEGIVKNSGLIQANGGIVQLATNARSAAINVTGIIEANQLVERDGVIRLEGGDNSKVEVSGKLLAKGENTTGGTIEVTGEQVALMNGALLDASGDTGGGKVLVGGDYQGANAAVYNARTTYIASGATIKADAIKQGDGGKVIVWANHATRFYGSISAQGGLLGGNGGFTEVSGKNYLDFAGRVNLAAVNGDRGTLLLDPENITLINGAASNTSGFQPGVDNQEAYNDNFGVDSVFNVGAGGSFTGVGNNANIVLQANKDINVNSEFNLGTATGNTGVSLTLLAKNDINLNANIIADGAGFVALTADSDSNNIGNLNLKADIVTDKGVVSLAGANITQTTGSDVTTNGGMVMIGSNGNVDLGDMKINTYDQSGGATQETGGNVLLLAGKDLTMSGEINTANPASTGVTYTGGQGGNVAVISQGNIDLQDTKINVAGESTTSQTVPISGSNVAISGNILIGANNNVTMNNGSLNTNGMGKTGAGTDVNLTGNVIVVANGDANLGTTQIDTSGSTVANGDGINGGAALLTGQNVTVGNINTNGSAPTSANGTGGAGGQVVAIANNGSVKVGDITAGGAASNGSGNAGDGGNVNLTSVGGTVTLQSIDTRGGVAGGSGTSGNGGTVDINGNALIATNAVIDSRGVTGGNVNFNGTVDSVAAGNRALTVNTNGTTNFTQSVGATKELASLTTDAGGTTEIFGSTMKTTGNQTYNDRVNLHTATTFETTSGGNVALNDVINAAGNAVIVKTGTGDFTANNAANQFASIQVVNGRNVSVRDADDITVESADMTGDLLVRAARDLTLNGNIVTTSGTATAVQLVAERNFNNAGNGSITTGAGGRWLVYSTSPTADTRGAALTASYDFTQYNASFGDTILGANDGFIYKVAPTVNVTLNGTSTKPFDGNNTVTDLSGLNASLSGFFNNDQAGAATPITGATFDNPSVGTNKPIAGTYDLNAPGVIVTAEGKQVYGYQFVETSNATGSITDTGGGTPPALGFASPRDDAGLGGLIPNNPILNTMFIVSLNPAAGDEEDLDAVACPTNEDSLGSTPILNSGVKLPDGVSSNCI
ncbi:MAG TPA: filamentous hemagglutinin N-terminal domain-containing protein [Methylophilus sp.]|uniref:two-partner secretion domain-containing protein n=1 Tax=Methylophilus sp. TaxID=29541 RepID=UPI002CFD24A8|nr:filamentous hemagglutinin N-terminal domain-containing protein [Methylophilus sp.]HSH86928.1 filamentous hemagglutinin N-terminal domain-containing protein [Methylophilus sp.]